MSSLVFISYRRDDVAAEAASIYRFVKEKLGEKCVFFDNTSIAPGDSWPDVIGNKIKKAKVVVAVIGPQWVRISDEWGMRRIDESSDWVRKEIETALTSGAKLIPVLVEGAKMPPPDKLPESIRDIYSKQYIELRRSYWDHDIQLLLAQLKSTKTKNISENPDENLFPEGKHLPPDPIPDKKLKVILEMELPLWDLVSSPLLESKDQVREELFRNYRFRSFRSAINFMMEVAPGCDIAMHHPRWENVWKTLSVYLSTWDGELHKITDRDITLAKYFDRAYLDFDRNK